MTRVSKRETPTVEPIPGINKLAFAVLGLIQVVCPLLFFTNLTRNPYYTQIALLNILVAVMGFIWAIDGFKKGELSIPRFRFEWPIVVFLIVAFLSSAWSWIHHPMLRPGILYESVRVWVFTVVNCIFALYLPALFTKPIGAETPSLSIWTDLILAAIWGALWLGFHSNKNPDPTALMWDGYGGILWGMGFLYAILRTRRGLAVEYFHVIFAVSVVAGLYGILQYAGKDIIWASLVMPYGGRPVSTFGNPNFLSSYLMLVCPLALAFGLKTSAKERIGYLFVSLVCAVAVLCTLTRSSYIGLFAALATMLVLLIRIDRSVILKIAGGVTVVFVALIFIFPKTPISAVQSPLLRFTEIFDAMKSGQAYGPWHQRILIWSSAWDMLQQSLWIGKGWGCFELFFPFFQGKYMYVPILAIFRTHANNAHNVLMEILAQVGIVGTGIALWLLVVMLISGLKIVRDESEGTGRFVSAALLSGMVGMVTDNFFGNVSIFFAMPAFLFWWNVGALENENKFRQIEKRTLTAVSRALLVVFMSVCVSVTIYFYRRWKQEIYYFEGFRESKIGDVVKSYKALEKAYEWFPGEVNSNYEMGNSYAQYARVLASKGLNEEAAKFQTKAIDAFRASLHANPGYDEIYFNLGVTQGQASQRDEAIRNLEISMYINPLLRDAYGALANLYIQSGDFANAVRVYNLAVIAYPKDKDFWNNLGYCYSQLKDHRKSFESYKKAVEVDPSFNQGWQNLGLAAQTLGEHKDPILQVPSLIQQMETAIAQKNFSSALNFALQAEKILPESPDAHLSLGNIYFYLNRTEQSESEFKRAIALRPNFVIAHVNLGRLYQVQGKMDLARAKFKDALGIDPNDKEAQSALNSLPKVH